MRKEGKRQVPSTLGAGATNILLTKRPKSYPLMVRGVLLLQQPVYYIARLTIIQLTAAVYVLSPVHIEILNIETS